MKAVLALVHSPLVGPYTWIPVANVLRRHGFEVIVPALVDAEGIKAPYWEQHARSAADALGSVPSRRSLILVSHSGAGPLLPAIAWYTPSPVAAYIFVDAGLPHAGQSRLSEMERNAPEFAGELRAHLEANGRFPEWTDDDLRDVIPDGGARHGLLAQLRPRPLAFFTEPIPVPDSWPEAPCGYIQFSEAYALAGEQARRNGWAYRGFDAAHFHMLVDPEAVADALLDLVRSLTHAP